MYRVRPLLAFALIVVICVAPVAHVFAQPAISAAGLDVGFGRSAGHSRRPLLNRGAWGMTAVASANVRQLPRGALLLSLTAHASGASTSIDCEPSLGTSPCLQAFPAMLATGLLVGWEVRHGHQGAAIRVAVGPSLVRPRWFATTGGVQGRLDVSTPSVAHVAIVGYAHHLAQLGDSALSIASFGVGLRVR